MQISNCGFPTSTGRESCWDLRPLLIWTRVSEEPLLTTPKTWAARRHPFMRPRNDLDLVTRGMRMFSTHGTGEIDRAKFRSLGNNVIFEPGVLAFHPENISVGDNVYVGHYAILKGYYKNELVIKDNVWIGQHCFLHGAGGLTIGKNVGIGPGVQILTAFHKEEGRGKSILFSDLDFAPVTLDDDCNIGVNSVILPGVKIGK